MKMFRNILSIILYLVAINQIHTSDYYSSVSGLEMLLKVEKQYLESLEEHLQEVEKLSKIFESYADEIEKDKNSNHTSQHLEDPINAFKALKRIVVDWKQPYDLTYQIRNLIGKSTSVGTNENYEKLISVFNNSDALDDVNFTPPTVEDLRGAARGLARLQHIYKLDSTSLAKGYLKSVKYSTPMSAVSCFVIGRSLIESKKYQYASDWLIEALHKVENKDDAIQLEYEDSNDINKDGDEHGGVDNDDQEEVEYEDSNDMDKDGNEHREDNDDLKKVGVYPYVTKVEILEWLGPALLIVGSRRLAKIVNSKLVNIDPKNALGLSNENIFKTAFKEDMRKKILAPPPAISKRQHHYELVCSGELQQTPQEKRQLRCRYVTNNVPYYLLGPLKMEELNSDPLVAYYHQVIYDSEIDQIINTVEGSIKRSITGSADKFGANENRISKNSWLHFEDHRFLDKISQRLEGITNLSTAHAEPLQVANYGIGGFYGVHYDFSPNPEKDFRDMGNRILTAMFYINDVELGGATVFPVLRLSVPPIKGSLLVWHNIHKSLELDHRTAHAGCPVLKGSKWIVNEWFHTVGQEFRRPCDLEADGEISKNYMKSWNSDSGMAL